MSSPKPQEPFHTVRSDLVKVPPTAQDQDAMEAAALQRLYGILEPATRDEVRKSLESPDFNEQLSINSIRSAEGARLLAEIYAVRWARRDAARLVDMQRLARLISAPVTVAVAQTDPTTKYAATIIRTPGTGENLIVLSSEDMSAQLLADAFVALAGSRAADGEIPAREVRMHVDRGITPRAPPEQIELAKPLVARLESAAPTDVKGVGRVPAITTTVGPV
ncbi:MAG: hypothetical protein M3303_07640 [Gemmatimonadota bacterium]|nr:hypothetical protein [Gemmatimonadota bacterium]